MTPDELDAICPNVGLWPWPDPTDQRIKYLHAENARLRTELVTAKADAWDEGYHARDTWRGDYLSGLESNPFRTKETPDEH